MIPDVRSILVCVDLAGSGATVRAAAHLAAREGAGLHLVYVAGSGAGDAWVPLADGSILDDAVEAVDAGAHVLSWRVLRAPAAGDLIELGGQVAPDLVVVDPNLEVHADDAALLLGDRIARALGVPCLELPGVQSLPATRVVLPIDPTDPAPGALETGLQWARRLATASSEVAVVHVIPTFLAELGIASDAPELRPMASDEPGTGPGYRLVSLCGDCPAEAIVHFARATRADLVILPSHGDQFVEKALHGSVSSAVARRAAGAVLILPPRAWQGRGVRHGLAGSVEA